MHNPHNRGSLFKADGRAQFRAQSNIKNVKTEWIPSNKQ